MQDDTNKFSNKNQTTSGQELKTSETNKHFSININQLGKSVQCMPFNEIVCQNADWQKYFEVR